VSQIESERKEAVAKAFQALDTVERAYVVDYGTISGVNLAAHPSVEIWYYGEEQPVYIVLSRNLIAVAAPEDIAAHYAFAVRDRLATIRQAS
jgi:hypothetical protein